MGDKNSNQRGRHGDDGYRHFPGPIDRRLEAAFAPGHMAVHVFHHDDGIIHHQSDRQHHGQQREQVQREPHQQHYEGATNQGQGHGN